MLASDLIWKAFGVHTLFSVGKRRSLTGSCYAGGMKQWADQEKQDDHSNLRLNLEFASLVALHLYAIYAAIEVVLV